MLARSPLCLLIGRRRVFCAWLLAVWFLFVASGIPLPDLGGKDLSQPFACMHSECGCRNAQQCWQSCCCHTTAERLAWARENNVAPPDSFLAQAHAEGVDDTTSLVSAASSQSNGNCCAGPVCKATPAPGGVSVVQAWKCHGLTTDWIVAGCCMPPAAVETPTSPLPGIWLTVPSEKALSALLVPQSPPPRAV